MVSKFFSLCLFVAILLPCSLPAQQISADTNHANGGRGGVVYHVFRTDDPAKSTFGTLRHAAEQWGARTIVFDIKGSIILTRDLILQNSDLTIAGQTAEEGSVGITGHQIVVDCSNVVIDGMYYTASCDTLSHSLSLQEILSIDSNMNGIPDQKEKRMFGELVDGNGHAMDPVMTNLEWYLIQLNRDTKFNGETAIKSLTAVKTDTIASSNTIVSQPTIGLPQGEYRIGGKRVVVE